MDFTEREIKSSRGLLFRRPWAVERCPSECRFLFERFMGRGGGWVVAQGLLMLCWLFLTPKGLPCSNSVNSRKRNLCRTSLLPTKSCNLALASGTRRPFSAPLNSACFTELAKGPQDGESLRTRLDLHPRSARPFGFWGNLDHRPQNRRAAERG